MEDELDREGALQDVYNTMKIGQKVEIQFPIKFVKGTIMDKYLELSINQRKELYIDVMMVDGNIVEHFLCYSGFYPRYALL